MPHLPHPLDEHAADPRLQALFEAMRGALGAARVPALFLALAVNPAVLQATFDTYRATILEGRVPVAIKQLIGRAIAHRYGCPAAALLDPADADAAIGGLALGSLPARDRAVVAFAERVAAAPHALLSENFEALRRLGLWDDEIFEIVAAARLFVSYVGLCQSLGLPSVAANPAPTPAPAGLSGEAALATLDRDELLALTRQLSGAGQALTTRLTALTEIALALTGTPVISEIYQVLTDQAKWVIDFEQVSIALLDDTGAAYHLHTLIADCRDLTCEPFISPYATFTAAEGLPGLALTTGQPVLTGQMAAHPHASPALEHELAAAQLASALILPLRIGGRAIGTLNFLAEAADQYNDDDLRVGRLLGQQLSAALEAARLYTQIEDERSTLLAVVQSTTNAVLVVGTNGQLLIANPAALALLALAPLAEATTLDAAITLPELRALFERLMREARPAADNVALADGRTFRAGLSPVQTAYGETVGFVAVLHDITHLVELDRMKSEFVSTVSHDLKNPIQAIEMTAELMPRMGELNERHTQMLARIEGSAAQMLALVSDLLDLGKIEAGFEMRREPCDLGALLVEVIHAQRPNAEAKRLHVSLDEPLPANGLWVRGDAGRLKQVAANLLSNAVKYTPEGGSVRLAVEAGDGLARVWVRDTGYGIPPAALPHIFEKFYRVQDTPAAEIEGTGLGLSICRSIIEQHGGRITVESEVGAGSAFCMALPLEVTP